MLHTSAATSSTAGAALGLLKTDAETLGADDLHVIPSHGKRGGGRRGSIESERFPAVPIIHTRPPTLTNDGGPRALQGVLENT